MTFSTEMGHDACSAMSGDSTHYVNAKDVLSLSLLRARLIDLKLPIKIVEGE